MEFTGWTIAFLLAVIVGVVALVIIGVIDKESQQLPDIGQSASCKLSGGACTDATQCTGEVIDVECGEGAVCCKQAST